MTSVLSAFRNTGLALIPLLGVFWGLDAPIFLGLKLTGDQFVLTIAGLCVACGFLEKPYGPVAGWRELTLALAGMFSWFWSAWNYADWLIAAGDRGPEKWIPGAIALLLLLEAVRRNCGAAIAALMAVIAGYGFLGHLLPAVLEAAYTEPRRLILYLYADSNGVPGLVLNTAATVVLAFIVFSKTLEVAGAARFFDDAALMLLGRFRGGPAKVAVVSSALFGIISGSSVANVVSSGIVTIPMMTRYGFSPAYAAAVEAVSSNAGQITPPVMGAAAFLIAEFLQIPYAQIVIAAIVPSLIFYVVLLVQIDTHAAQRNLQGLAPDQLPGWHAVRPGWVFVIPIALLVYWMFWLGYNATKAALLASGAMLVLAALRKRGLPDRKEFAALTIGAGRDLVQILLVSAAAGIVVGVLNISGLSFNLTLLLGTVAANAGTVVLLLATAAIAIVLGMGMPTAAVYVLLSVVLAPTLIDLGIHPLAAHLFIFYFGLLSMLTPPVAMASFAAATLAGSDLWVTSWVALKLGASGYLLPFLFALNPALLAQGTASAVLIAVTLTCVSGVCIAWAVEGGIGARAIGFSVRAGLLAAALVLGVAAVQLK